MAVLDMVFFCFISEVCAMTREARSVPDLAPQ